MALDTPSDNAAFATPPAAPPPPPSPPPRPRRAAASWAWLAVPVVIVAAVPAGAWIIGGRVEAGYAMRLAETVKQAPVFAKARVTYHRELFGATRTTTLDLREMYGNCLSQLQARPGVPMVLSVVEHIQHGPFPGFRTVGAARVTYEARINGQPLASYFGRPLGGANGPVLKLVGRLPQPVTTIGFDASATTTVEGGAGSVTLVDNSKKAAADADAGAPPAAPTAFALAWQAVDSRAALNGRGDRLKTKLDFDGLAFTIGPVFRLSLGRLVYDAERTRSAEAGWWLPSGTTHFTLDRLEAGASGQGGAGSSEPVFSAADIRVDGDDTVTNGLYGSTAKGTLGKLSVLGETLGPIDFDYGLSRLDAAGWRALIDASYGPLLKGCPVPLDQQDPQERTAETLTALKSLLLKDPEVRVNRLAVTWGGKQASAKGTLRLAGIEPADLRAPDPSGLVRKLDGQGELRLDDGFVGVVAAAAAKRSVLQAHKASAATGAIPPELFQRMAQAKTDAEQAAVIAEIRQAQAQATVNVTDARLLADPAVQAEIKATTKDNVQKAQATRDQLVAQGVLVREGSQLVVRGAIKGGQATINGKPADSFKAAMGGDHEGTPPAG